MKTRSRALRFALFLVSRGKRLDASRALARAGFSIEARHFVCWSGSTWNNPPQQF